MLLHSLGVRLVLVHGSRPQIESRLAERGLTPHYHRGLRITDAATLDCVIDAVGALRLAIEARLSMDIAASPMQGSRLRVASGNLVTARPIGVLEGVDYHHTGEVRRVDRKGISRLLDERSIVLLSPLGYSPTGRSSTWPARTSLPARPSTWVPTSCCCSAPSQVCWTQTAS